MKPTQSVVAAFLLICAIIPSCVSSSSTDPGFAQLEAQVNPSPSPTAIVGLWQRIGITQLVGDRIDERKSNLYRADGTGVQKARHRFSGQDHDLPPAPFRWRYEGDGSWSTTIDNPQARYRIAGDALLYYLDASGTKIRHVYRRSH